MRKTRLGQELISGLEEALRHARGAKKLRSASLEIPEPAKPGGRVSQAAYDKDSVIDTAMRIIKDEHDFRSSGELDDEDYIPWIVRTAESAGRLLASGGMGQRETKGNVERIIAHGRRLYVQEWMQPIPGETSAPCERDAVEQFERCVGLARRRERERRRLSGSGRPGPAG